MLCYILYYVCCLYPAYGCQIAINVYKYTTCTTERIYNKVYNVWCALIWLLSGFRGVCYIKQLVLAAAVMSVSSICALMSAVAMAFLLDHTGHAMSWFSTTFLLFGLYVAPACCLMLSTCVAAKKLFYKVLLNFLHFNVLLHVTMQSIQ